MQYLLLVYADESTGPPPDSAEEEVMWAAHEHFSEDMSERGHLVSGRALRPSDTATTVRRRNGATLTADGPAAQTAEQLAGFYLVEADDLDQAIDMASRIPTSCHGSIEVRPVVDWDDAGD